MCPAWIAGYGHCHRRHFSFCCQPEISKQPAQQSSSFAQYSTAQHSMLRRHMAQHSSIQVISSSETAKVSSNAAKAALEVNMPYSDGSHALKGHICI